MSSCAWLIGFIYIFICLRGCSPNLWVAVDLYTFICIYMRMIISEKSKHLHCPFLRCFEKEVLVLELCSVGRISRWSWSRATTKLHVPHLWLSERVPLSVVAHLKPVARIADTHHHQYEEIRSKVCCFSAYVVSIVPRRIRMPGERSGANGVADY